MLLRLSCLYFSVFILIQNVIFSVTISDNAKTFDPSGLYDNLMENSTSIIRRLVRQQTQPFLTKQYNAENINNLVNYILTNPEPMNEMPFYIYILQKSIPDWIMYPIIPARDIGSFRPYPLCLA